MVTRREFLRAGSLAALTVGAGGPRLRRALATPVDVAPRAGDPTLRELAMTALDAARAAGATYADVRLTVTRTQSFRYASPPLDAEHVEVGVRALAHGNWGFAASPDWTLDVLARLGREATAQAKANAWRGAPPVELGDPPPPATGTWVMPVERDPFSVAVEEKLDYIRAAEAYARTFRNGSASSVIVFERQERTFASTDGAFCTQTVYDSLGHESFFSVGVNDPVTYRNGRRLVGFVGPTGAGYEVFERGKLLDLIPQLYEEARRQLDPKPFDIGRYEVVFDAGAMATLVDATIGTAMELDRALGLEANAGGTSYLAPPERVLGSAVASPLLTITADRSMPGGAATVQWDAEGVAPAEFTLVDQGIATTYATDRTLASALPAANRNDGAPHSLGCAVAESAGTVPLIYTPNLTVQPARDGGSFEDLVADVADGFAVVGGRVYMDYQQLTGEGEPEVIYRIRRGKLAEVVSGAAYLFRSPTMWKNLVALGGPESAVVRGMTREKGQPSQRAVHSVRAVPARFKDVSLVDLRGGVPTRQRA
ncbi:MAG: TldD/PmbA family protein [Gemmatimonadaceae bacterium]|nr:TldD/PmbA family protein [Gemmatimonadaceae bacterium]